MLKVCRWGKVASIEFAVIVILGCNLHEVLYYIANRNHNMKDSIYPTLKATARFGSGKKGGLAFCFDLSCSEDDAFDDGKRSVLCSFSTVQSGFRVLLSHIVKKEDRELPVGSDRTTVWFCETITVELTF